jgi:methylated-DNA-[protein]-cysteine S-methyltransferase
VSVFRELKVRHDVTLSSGKRGLMNTENFEIERFDTPTGRMTLITDAEGRVRSLDWQDHDQRMQQLLQRYYRGVSLRLCDATRESRAKLALLAYFDGRLDALSELPIVTHGTLFQSEVWRALRSIPHGQTLSYGALAKEIGRPAAVRAVGLANGRNPIAIIVPCHRVIGADSTLTGYGGGLERKRWLLDHEGVPSGASASNFRRSRG